MDTDFMSFRAASKFLTRPETRNPARADAGEMSMIDESFFFYCAVLNRIFAKAFIRTSALFAWSFSNCDSPGVALLEKLRRNL
jgi:hypothetical protein